MTLNTSVNLIELDRIPLDAIAADLRSKAVAAAPSEEEYDRKHPKYDWQRLTFVQSQLRPGQRCLDVGPGRGYLSTMLHRNGLFKELYAIDIVNRTNRLPSDVTFSMTSVAEMHFPDNFFDSVICLEVLEHLDDATFVAALRELRRVTKGQLLISVPFREPMPSKYHLQSFHLERIRDLFPAGDVSLMIKTPVMRVPWIFVHEDHA